MPTLMQWSNSDGILGRCDAKCHDAAEPACDCMCGGRYHGAARQGVLDERIRTHWDEIVEAAQARAQAEGVDLEVFGYEFELDFERGR